jgi:cbb3-type cytochrome oxidase subunit 3
MTKNSNFFEFFCFYILIFYIYIWDIMAKKEKKLIFQNAPYVLPSQDEELNSYILKYKTDLTEHVLSSIDFALQNNLFIVEVFQFKESELIITLAHDSFELNINNIYDYYLKNELYEFCGRALQIKQKIQHEKEKSNPKPKNSK